MWQTFAPSAEGPGPLFLKKCTRAWYFQFLFRLSWGKVESYCRVCVQCRVRTSTGRERYKEISRRKKKIADLVNLTHPNFGDRYLDRLELERMVREYPEKITKEEREYLLMEPLEYLDSALDLKENPEAPVRKTDLILFALYLTTLFISLSATAILLLPPEVSSVMLVILAIGIIVGAFFFDRFSRGRFVKSITPGLINCFETLKISPEERNVLFSRGWKILKYLDRERLDRELKMRGGRG